jgi:two-component system, OmpR family, response regulator
MEESMSPLERILYVEDDPDIRAVGTFALQTVGGLTVQACASGAEALVTMAAFDPQLLLLDVMMPELDGPATLVALRGLDGTSSTPAVFMTAKVQSKEVQHYREIGAVDVIAKPFDPMTLAVRLRAIYAQTN